LRDANAAGLGQALHPGRDVHPVAKDVVVIVDDVADVDADAALDALVLRNAGVALGHATAQRTASTALANSTSMPSPVVLMILPRCSLIRPHLIRPGARHSLRWSRLARRRLTTCTAGRQMSARNRSTIDVGA
jgi:hypothetical protein